MVSAWSDTFAPSNAIRPSSAPLVVSCAPIRTRSRSAVRVPLAPAKMRMSRSLRSRAIDVTATSTSPVRSS